MDFDQTLLEDLHRNVDPMLVDLKEGGNSVRIRCGWEDLGGLQRVSKGVWWNGVSILHPRVDDLIERLVQGVQVWVV